MTRPTVRLLSVLLGYALAATGLASAQIEVETKVRLLRVPDGGLQPQALVENETAHLLYFQGEPAHGDLFHVRWSNTTETFSPAIRVNNQAGSAVAMGTIRGGQIALGQDGRVHVAWNGSSQAQPKGPKSPKMPEDNPHNGLPMLYARLNDSGTAFEPQRNLMTRSFALDGGGSIAADGHGNIYVAWHASDSESPAGEAGRRVWLSHSRDGGKTFSPERPIQDERTGACGCCGLRILAGEESGVFALFRSASRGVQRDITLLESDQGDRFRAHPVHPWQIGTCPMSSMSLLASGSRVLCAWETDGQVHFGAFDRNEKQLGPVVTAPGPRRGRKHPVMAVNTRGELILVWTEGTGWKLGGSVAWQVFDSAGRPTATRGRQDGVPVWSLAAVFARADGSFVIVY